MLPTHFCNGPRLCGSQRLLLLQKLWDGMCRDPASFEPVSKHKENAQPATGSLPWGPLLCFTTQRLRFA